MSSPGAPSPDRPDDLPRGDEPGADSTPYADGEGTVGLQDRLGGTAPDTNQGKTEPFPPTSGHPEASPQDGAQDDGGADAASLPDLGDLGAGAAAAHLASPDVLADQAGATAPTASAFASSDASPGDARGVPATSRTAAAGTSQEQAPVDGVADLV